MSRWIDAEWLLNFFEPYPNDYQTPLGSLRACVDDAPSIDICFCRECKFGEADTEAEMYRCRNVSFPMWNKADDFCSYGEREGE